MAAAGGLAAPPTGDAAALGRWATQAADLAARRGAEARHAAAVSRSEATTARRAVEDKCHVAGVQPGNLIAWRAQADAAVGRAQAEEAAAVAAATRCAQLEHALEATAGRAKLLEAGKALSRGRGNFVFHVLAARRRQLLLEAAAILSELSGGRLVFDTEAVDRFEVTDTTTGVARDPRLLSGGEQFQASLALALGLVEIAARGGSRIECLFLDEGFAALDNRSLDVALDALETAAQRGRQIVAVTHVDAVTSRCDQILEVRSAPGGSTATWRESASV